MSSPPRILAFAGSARAQSFNKRLAAAAAAGAEAAGASCTVVDLRDYPLPLYDGDEEAASGLPENAAALKALFLDHQGLLIACPEYNGSITPLLKNTIDWISRSPEGRPDLAPYRDKVVGLMGASPGALGGLRGLGVVRALLTNVGCTVLPDQLTLRQAHQAFAEDGSVSDEKQAEKIAAFAAGVAEAVRRWHA